MYLKRNVSKVSRSKRKRKTYNRMVVLSWFYVETRISSHIDSSINVAERISKKQAIKKVVVREKKRLKKKEVWGILLK